MKTQLLAVALVALVACGDKDKKGGDDNDGDATKVGVVLTPSSVSVTPGSSQTVQISIGRTGDVVGAAVSLSVTNVPNGVIAELDTTSTTASTATLTVSALANAQQVTQALTVTASALSVASNAIASAQLVVTVAEPPTVTVTGKAVSANLIPLNAVTVTLWSHGSSTPKTATTDATGTFTISGVTTPYDVKLSTLGVSGLQALWLGLTRTDPLLSSYQVQTGNNSISQTSLTFSGGQGFGPQPANTLVAYTIGCPSAGANGNTNLATDTKLLEGYVPGGQQCTVNVLQHRTADNMADRFSFGTGTITPTATGTTSKSIALDTTDVAVHDVTINAVAESSDPLSRATMFWHNQKRTVKLGEITSQADGYSATVKAPDDNTLGVVMEFNQTVGNAQVNLAKHLTGSAIDVSIPDAPSVVSPTSGLIDAASTSFTINGSDGSGYVYFLGSTPGDQVLYVSTMQTSLPVGVLTAHDMPLETGESFHWQFYTFSNIATADDLAGTQATVTGYMDTDGASYSLSVPGNFSTP